MSAAGEVSGSRPITAVAHAPSGLKRVLRWVARISGVLLAVAVGGFLCRDSIFKAVLIQQIRHETGLRAEVGELRTAVGSAVLHVRDFKVYSGAEFGGGVLLDVPELFLEMDTQPLTDRSIHFKEVRFHLAELNIVRDANGRTNLEKLEKTWREHLRKRRNRQKRMRWEFAGIDQLRLSIGTISFKDLGYPKLSRVFQVDLHDEAASHLQDEEAVQSWASDLALRFLLEKSLKLPGKGKRPMREAAPKQADVP